MGVGRRLLDELSELVRSKTGRPGSLAESDAFRTNLAKTEARFRAAVALVDASWADVESSIEAGHEITVRQDTLVRIALGNITDALAAVASFVYLSGGTTALRKGSPIERLVRDVQQFRRRLL